MVKEEATRWIVSLAFMTIEDIAEGNLQDSITGG